MIDGNTGPEARCKLNVSILVSIATISGMLDAHYIDTIAFYFVRSTHFLTMPPFPWVSSVDATHQKLFPRTFAEIEGKYDFLSVFYDVINCPEVSVFPASLPAVTTQEFPFLTETRILFVEPHFKMMHDGGCPRKCPKDNSLLVETVGGAPRNPGDLYESRSFAFFSLRTGEIMALCNWDYRD